jgi:hypothetical protein
MTDKKIYGISEIIEHPQGFNYICAYLDSKKSLSNSLMLCAWDRKTKIKMEIK